SKNVKQNSGNSRYSVVERSLSCWASTSLEESSMRFSVVGADKETGDDVDVVLVASTREVAEVEAGKKGILVSAIKPLEEEKDVIDLVTDVEPAGQDGS